jgi:NADH dehydrogenase
MINQKTIVVVGGGYAGINLTEALKKEFYSEIKEKIRIILIDKNTFHFKKVKLFKAIVNENVSDLQVPLDHFCGSSIEFIQGELTKVNHEEQTIYITKVDGVSFKLNYDQLVLAMGSVLCDVDSEHGGFALTSIEKAKFIREQLLKKMDSPNSKLRLAIVGSGITGIETAAELGSWLKNEAEQKVIEMKNIELFLINDKHRLLNEAPVKISEKLENRLKKHGIDLIHNKRAVKFIENKVFFSDNSQLEADFCLWTVGLKPHPSLSGLGFPLTKEGKLMVDSSYRLVETENIFAIGDCVHVVDPISGSVAAMSCKEAISQAGQLAKIMKAHLEDYTAPSHQSYPILFCIGLGPNDGFVWAQKWGVDFVLWGKIAEKIREYTWNLASLHF